MVAASCWGWIPAPAGWLRDPLGFVPGVLAAGPRGVWVATQAPALLHVVAA